ncbi:MAG TPA: glutaredoxin family protein, partial [Nitrospiraceae bacterium]
MRSARTGIVPAVLLLASALLIALSSGMQAHAGEAPDLEIFVRTGCPHCEAAKNFLKELQREHPSLRIAVYDIAQDAAARQRLSALTAERGLATIGVPTFLIGTELIVGFLSNDTTGVSIRTKLDQRSHENQDSPEIEGIRTRWFGALHVTDVGLPLFTVIIGLIDGLNP